MKSLYLLVFMLLTTGIITDTKAQTPVPEDYFDMYDGDEEEENEENNEEDNTFKMPNDEELKALGQALDSIGSLGKIVTGAAKTYRMGEEGCSKTYICMWNTLDKYANIFNYEKKLSRDKLDCKERQIIIEDYILFIASMNLDNYCIEHLHPDNNELENVELIDAMLAMGYYGLLSFEIPILKPYMRTYQEVDPFCTNQTKPNGIIFEDFMPKDLPCSCGEYVGTFDRTEKEKVLQDIRTILDDINPIWQGQKLLELNQMLQALPCNN